MKNLKKIFSNLFVVSLIVACLAGFSRLSLATESTAKPSAQKVFMKLDHGTDDLHAVLMTFKIAENLVKKGSKVTLFLNLEGVRIADKRQPIDLKWGMEGGHSAQHLYDSFVKNGGTILVCPMCAKNVGITGKELRTGAKLTNEDEISSALLEADKSLSY